MSTARVNLLPHRAERRKRAKQHFAVVSAGVVYLRMTQPDVERPFKTPLIWFTGPMGVISSIILMATLPRDTWIRLIVWMMIGLFIYFLYGMQHSVLGAKYPSGQIAQPAVAPLE